MLFQVGCSLHCGWFPPLVMDCSMTTASCSLFRATGTSGRERGSDRTAFRKRHINHAVLQQLHLRKSVGKRPASPEIPDAGLLNLFFRIPEAIWFRLSWLFTILPIALPYKAKPTCNHSLFLYKEHLVFLYPLRGDGVLSFYF